MLKTVVGRHISTLDLHFSAACLSIMCQYPGFFVVSAVGNS